MKTSRDELLNNLKKRLKRADKKFATTDEPIEGDLYQIVRLMALLVIHDYTKESDPVE